MASVIIVEDEQRIRTLLARGLAERGHNVETFATAMEGLQGFVDTKPDLVVLDLGLPDLDGLELLKMIRAIDATPVIVATARSDDTEIVEALNIGADDYMVKPFSVDQLEARARAVLRRVAGQAEDVSLVVGGLGLDAAGRAATLDGAVLELTPKEFDLLLYLARNQDVVVSKRQILAEVWREPFGGSEKTVDVHLSWLRKKLGETAASPRYIHSVFGVGVKLVAPE